MESKGASGLSITGASLPVEIELSLDFESAYNLAPPTVPCDGLGDSVRQVG